MCLTQFLLLEIEPVTASVSELLRLEYHLGRQSRNERLWLFWRSLVLNPKTDRMDRPASKKWRGSLRRILSAAVCEYRMYEL
ncbi:hypothetical protein EVAR_51549_1 [Eumeta japonica]|uniref:Uncharacterized protein n=1 Tax=Eumeta variegata TaxID=151549 RepID=A0A4C1YJ50_EUMVA|nr:hypothetical protein EVAR_51549_1 [Eumeta japonica]